MSDELIEEVMELLVGVYRPREIPEIRQKTLWDPRLQDPGG